SGSLTRVAPKVAISSRVSRAMKRRATASAMANTRSQRLKSAKKAPSARTVPRSVTKQAARIIFPRLVRLRPVSTITAYITATEMPVRIETTLATKASSIHAAATNQTLVACAIIGSTRSLPPDVLEGHDSPSLAAHETLPDVRQRRNASFGQL